MSKERVPDEITGTAYRRIVEQGLKGKYIPDIIDGEVAASDGVQHIGWPTWELVPVDGNKIWFFSKTPVEK